MFGSLGSPSLVDWAIASRALQGERESGDLYLVRPCPAGILVAVVDGLGHGDEAATAARVAVAALEASSLGSITQLVRYCHDRLVRTRGVAMSIALFDSQGSTMTWLGVGNVEGLLMPGGHGNGRTREFLVSRGGVVGYKLPLLRATTVPVAPGDILILATDGIDPGFGHDLPLDDSPRTIAETILARYGKDTDDALVLVARYLG